MVLKKKLVGYKITDTSIGTRTWNPTAALGLLVLVPCAAVTKHQNLGVLTAEMESHISESCKSKVKLLGRAHALSAGSRGEPGPRPYLHF